MWIKTYSSLFCKSAYPNTIYNRHINSMNMLDIYIKETNNIEMGVCFCVSCNYGMERYAQLSPLMMTKEEAEKEMTNIMINLENFIIYDKEKNHAV